MTVSAAELLGGEDVARRALHWRNPSVRAGLKTPAEEGGRRPRHRGRASDGGSGVIALELARRLAREWLGYEFDPSSKIEAICGYDPVAQ